MTSTLTTIQEILPKNLTKALRTKQVLTISPMGIMIRIMMRTQFPMRVMTRIMICKEEDQENGPKEQSHPPSHQQSHRGDQWYGDRIQQHLLLEIEKCKS